MHRMVDHDPIVLLTECTTCTMHVETPQLVMVASTKFEEKNEAKYPEFGSFF